jgi:hypothetical protein
MALSTRAVSDEIHRHLLENGVYPLLLENDTCALRKFSSPRVVSEPINPSSCLYDGMIETLRLLKDHTEEKNIHDVCVIGPYYKLSCGRDLKPRGGDIQPCGGGKLRMGEDFEVGVKREMMEELRIEHLESRQCVSKTHCNSTDTLIFSFCATDCVGIAQKKFALVNEHQPSRPYGSYSRPSGAYSRPSGAYSRPSGAYSRPSGAYSRPRDDYSKRVGFIIWGTLKECYDLVSSIGVGNADELNDGIEGIAILTLPTAIKFATPKTPKEYDFQVTSSF